MHLLGSGAQTSVWQLLLVFFSLSHFVLLPYNIMRQTAPIVNLWDNSFLIQYISHVFYIMWSRLGSVIIQILLCCSIPSIPFSSVCSLCIFVVLSSCELRFALNLCWFSWQGVLRSVLVLPCYGTQASFYWTEW